MVKKLEEDRVRKLLHSTITSLCQESLPYDSELSIQGLLAVTVDNHEIFLFDVKESICNKNSSLLDDVEPHRKRKRKVVKSIPVVNSRSTDNCRDEDMIDKDEDNTDASQIQTFKERTSQDFDDPQNIELCSDPVPLQTCYLTDYSARDSAASSRSFFATLEEAAASPSPTASHLYAEENPPELAHQNAHTLQANMLLPITGNKALIDDPQEAPLALTTTKRYTSPPSKPSTSVRSSSPEVPLQRSPHLNEQSDPSRCKKETNGSDSCGLDLSDGSVKNTEYEPSGIGRISFPISSHTESGLNLGTESDEKDQEVELKPGQANGKRQENEAGNELQSMAENDETIDVPDPSDPFLQLPYMTTVFPGPLPDGAFLDANCNSEKSFETSDFEPEKKHTCPICSKEFHSESKMKRHIKHHEKKRCHMCTLCDKSFKTKSHLSDHLLYHSGQKPHKCPVCSKGFGRKYHMKMHATRCHPQHIVELDANFSGLATIPNMDGKSMDVGGSDRELAGSPDLEAAENKQVNTGKDQIKVLSQSPPCNSPGLSKKAHQETNESVHLKPSHHKLKPTPKTSLPMIPKAVDLSLQEDIKTDDEETVEAMNLTMGSKKKLSGQKKHC